MKKDSRSAQVFKIVFPAILVPLIAVLFSCGRDKGSDSISSGNTPIPATPSGTVVNIDCPTTGTTDVLMKDEEFTPQTANIGVNGIVKWINGDQDDPVPHNWNLKGDFTLEAIGKNPECLQFLAAGTYNYHCADNVTGRVIVK
jgi:plastocyanin